MIKDKKTNKYTTRNNAGSFKYSDCGSNIGSRVVREALNRPNLSVNILVRDQEHNHDICEAVEKAGGRVFKGDVMNPNSISGITKGIHTVISCLQDEHKCLFDGQMNLLNDCIQNGVQRFVPSDFSVDYSKIQTDEHPFIEYKKRFREELSKTNIKGLHINFGLILENFLNHQINGLHYWQNKNQVLSLTCYDDAAKFIVEAISDPNRTGQLNFASAQLRISDIAHIIHKVNLLLHAICSYDDMPYLAIDSVILIILLTRKVQLCIIMIIVLFV